MRDHKPYLFYGQTSSLCETCLAVVPAKILIEGNDVFYQKRCADHGVQKTLISTDAAYYKRCRDYLKPGDIPLAFQSRTIMAAPMIAAFALITSSIAAWRCWKSTRTAT